MTRVVNLALVYHTILGTARLKQCINFSAFVSIPSARTNIPLELHRSDAWHPTLGHMANTAFGDMVQCRFRDFEHPRWGLITALVTETDIR